MGGAGYTGSELLRLLVDHPRAEITMVTSDTLAGKRLDREYLNLKGKTDLVFEPYKKEDVLKRCDFVFLAKPHPNSFTLVRELFGKVRIIDLSADFRFSSEKDFRRWYQTAHLAPEFLKESAYGLTEIFAGEIRKAKLVANPGCYPTGIILAIFPLLREELVSKEISVSSVSGFSGAGRTPSPNNLAYFVVDNIRPYRVGSHPHGAEVEEVIERALGKKIRLNFVPQVAGFERGILSIIFLNLKKEASWNRLFSLYQKTYHNCPFVRIYPEGGFPEIKNVVMTNFCDIGLQPMKSGKILVISSLDNLVKGAAGQAIQNFNVMAGLPEEEGLC